MSGPARCPVCDQPLTQVGSFGICPVHGQVASDKPSARLRIFLSYGHDANEELVRRIKADLEQRGHDVWFDKSEIKSGDDWRRTITEGIAGSHKFVSFLSRHSTRDPGVCRDEIVIALTAKGGNIQTVLVESEREVQPPVSVSHIQWLDMHDWKDRRAGGDAAWDDWYRAKFAEIVRVVESDESRRFAGEIEALNGHLKPVRSEARICQLLSRGFTGRRWVFEALENWRQNWNAGSRLFWIMGAPGVGKSAFAAQLTQLRSDIVLAAQFCEWDKPDHRNAQRVVRSLAFQLATRLPDYRKLLLSLPEIAQLDSKTPDSLFDYLLANPLKSVIDGGRQQALILVDALDEAGEGGRNPLVEMLARNAERLPAWLGFVVTSRPEFDVRASFQALNPFPLDTRSESNLVDLREYLRRQLASPLHGRADADQLVEQILEKSEGVFLYAERFCDEVRHGRLSLDSPKRFPQGLGGIFAQYFLRQFPDAKTFQREVRPALRAILAAREALPLEVLQDLFCWNEEELGDFIRPLASLFPVTTDGGRRVIRPYHKSLADWLGEAAKAGAYFVSRDEGHRQLAEAGLACFRQEESPPAAPATLAGRVGGWLFRPQRRARQFDSHPAVLDYWAKSLLSHVCAAQDWDQLVSCFAEPKVFQNLWPGSYGLEFGYVCGSDLKTLWPESRSLAAYAGGRHASAADEVTPKSLDVVPAEQIGRVAWGIAEALAGYARDVQQRAFELATRAGYASNTARRNLQDSDSPAYRPYVDLIFAFADLAGMAAEFAMSDRQFEQVGVHEGQPVRRARDGGFSQRAREFVDAHRPVRSYLRYLANFCRCEGWGGQLEDQATWLQGKWRTLAMIAYGNEVPTPQFVKLQTAGEVNLTPPWYGVQTKAAGVDAFMAQDHHDNGEKYYYLVLAGHDGGIPGWEDITPRPG